MVSQKDRQKRRIVSSRFSNFMDFATLVILKILVKFILIKIFRIIKH